MGPADLSKLIQAQVKLTKHWPGEPIDAYGIVRVINPTGQRLPIVWVFNAMHEPAALSSAFGSDQPLYLLRSLNQILKTSSDRHESSRHLASYYAEKLQSVLAQNIALVGGNCQGAPIALWLVQDLLAKNFNVLSSAAIDARPWIKVCVPLQLNFGIDWCDDSVLWGKMEDPVVVNEKFYTCWEVADLPYRHGTFFNQGNVEYLANNLREFVKKNECFQKTQQFPLGTTPQTRSKDALL